MKKLLAIVLCLAMCFVFVACGDNDGKNTNWGNNNNGDTTNAVENVISENVDELNPSVQVSVPNTTQTDAQKFVDEQGEAFLSELESGFVATAGTGCSSSIVANGNGVLITIKINGVNNVTAEEKATMQSAYDASSATFSAALSSLRTEYPGISSLTINVCEEDGDLLAVISAN